MKLEFSCTYLAYKMIHRLKLCNPVRSPRSVFNFFSASPKYNGILSHRLTGNVQNCYEKKRRIAKLRVANKVHSEKVFLCVVVILSSLCYACYWIPYDSMNGIQFINIIYIIPRRLMEVAVHCTHRRHCMCSCISAPSGAHIFLIPFWNYSDTRRPGSW